MIQHKAFQYRGFLFLFLFAFAISGHSQDNESNSRLSAGLRFNNPFGITVKKYWNDNAIEVVLGRSNPWRYNGYYRFRNKHEKNGYRYSGFDPIYRPLVVQAHFMKQKQITRIPQLSFYYGAGGQLRNYNYYLNYTYESNGITYEESFKEHHFAVGLDALAGLEFKFKSIPLVLFYDLTLYTEIVKQPLFMNFDSSWGIRYYW